MTDIEIEAFLAIVHAGSFSKAAGELYISQSALSRRIQALEEELGYQLIIRNKGIRNVELTPSGYAFVEAATKWKLLWNEMQEIGKLNNETSLNISVINSVNAYIMPGFFHEFMVENPSVYLTIRTVRSLDSCRYVENGTVDLAIFSDDSYTPNAEMKPAYREPLLLVCRRDLGYPEEVHPGMLDVSRHLYMPWNREYEAWYRRWFKGREKPKVWFDNIHLMEEFLLLNDYWTIVPASAAHKMSRNPELSIHTIAEGPPDRIIFYQLGPYQKPEATKLFLACFDKHLKTNHKESVESLIRLE